MRDVVFYMIFIVFAIHNAHNEILCYNIISPNLNSFILYQTNILNILNMFHPSSRHTVDINIQNDTITVRRMMTTLSKDSILNSPNANSILVLPGQVNISSTPVPQTLNLIVGFVIQILLF